MKNKFLIAILVLNLVAPLVSAQTLNSTKDNLNINATPNPSTNKGGFQFTVCDGPAGIQNPPAGYVPCDFNAVMLQVQHLINILLVFGVLGAIGSFCYAGYLYITGVEKNISQAKEIFRKVFIGFIIMLTAWFVVYQILSWLTGPSSGYSSLLGKP